MGKTTWKTKAPSHQQNWYYSICTLYYLYTVWRCM